MPVAFKKMTIRNILFIIGTGLFYKSVYGGVLSVSITSSDGDKVENAVVTLSPTVKTPLKSSDIYIVDQIDKTFVPHVKIITTGSKVNFPNKDNIRHHVYSFSGAKKFDLPLYEGTPAEPITFNNSGVVVLGCNIHDWMRGYIYISDTPYYGLTNNSGYVKITNIPPGKYSLRVWHPQISIDGDTKITPITISSNATKHYKETISLKPAIKIRRAPTAKRRNY
jgi:plastocyanin